MRAEIPATFEEPTMNAAAVPPLDPARVALVERFGGRIEPLDPKAADRLAGQRLVLFRPAFGVDTAWAYRQLASRPECYEARTSADQRLLEFCRGGDPGDLLHNTFEAVVGRKFLAIPCLLEKLRGLDYRCMMSGSGSACFALIENGEEATELVELCRECWGQNTFWVETSLPERKMW